MALTFKQHQVQFEKFRQRTNKDIDAGRFVSDRRLDALGGNLTDRRFAKAKSHPRHEKKSQKKSAKFRGR